MARNTTRFNPQKTKVWHERINNKKVERKIRKWFLRDGLINHRTFDYIIDNIFRFSFSDSKTRKPILLGEGVETLSILYVNDKDLYFPEEKKMLAEGCRLLSVRGVWEENLKPSLPFLSLLFREKETRDSVFHVFHEIIIEGKLSLAREMALDRVNMHFLSFSLDERKHSVNVIAWSLSFDPVLSVKHKALKTIKEISLYPHPYSFLEHIADKIDNSRKKLISSNTKNTDFENYQLIKDIEDFIRHLELRLRRR